MKALTRSLMILLVLAPALGYVREARGACRQLAADVSLGDSALFGNGSLQRTPVNCNGNPFVSCKPPQSFADWGAYVGWAYDIRCNDGGWSGRGCGTLDLRKEYSKHVTAAYLLNWGPVDNNAQSWHGRDDYRGTAERHTNNFHDALRHIVSDDRSVNGRFERALFGSDELYTMCPLYDSVNPATKNNPASRAGDFIHEGWHAWQNKWLGIFGISHVPNPPGGHCKMMGSECDFFYAHNVSVYPFGAMWQADNLPGPLTAGDLGPRAHSPNQAQVEFLCDLANPETSSTWIPTVVRDSARTDANQRISDRFTNAVSFVCGSARPF